MHAIKSRIRFISFVFLIIFSLYSIRASNVFSTSFDYAFVFTTIPPRFHYLDVSFQIFKIFIQEPFELYFFTLQTTIRSLLNQNYFPPILILIIIPQTYKNYLCPDYYDCNHGSYQSLYDILARAFPTEIVYEQIVLASLEKDWYNYPSSYILNTTAYIERLTILYVSFTIKGSYQQIYRTNRAF
jgi:hypothetical protein